MTVVVDVANVIGSRPDGWWRDRTGAAVRLHADLARLAASGRTALPPEAQPPGQGDRPGFVMVLEGAARAAASRITGGCVPAPGGCVPASGDCAAAAPPGPGTVRVIEAGGSGDDAIVAVARDLPGHRVVVTADRELRRRAAAAGAALAGPGWLLGQLRW